MAANTTSSGFKQQSFAVPVSESIGEVSALVTAPKKPVAVWTLAHGAGAGMDHTFMASLADALARHSLLTVRFNFPYVEKGRRRPDVPAVAEKTVEVVLRHVHELYPGLPLFASGKSFGGRMTSQLLARLPLPFVKGVAFFGFPLHAAGQPSVTRAAHLEKITVPMLFLQGTRDALADSKLIAKVCGKLDPATLVTFDGADHSFKVKKNYLIAELAGEAAAWCRTVGG